MISNQFNSYSENLLAEFSRRNTAAVTAHINGLCHILRQEGEVVQTMFGGSIQRGTYINGLSDVDVLLIVNESSLASRPPAEAIEHVRQSIARRLNQNQVRSGNLAVTVDYADGTEIQVLPAVRRANGGVRIADPVSGSWSNVTRPENFARKLVQVNQARSGRVIPTIKLAKAIADCFIRQPAHKIKGYHMESLAIEAFRDYQGALDNRSMLNRLFQNSVRAVKRPIADSTGQSRCVDEYLGAADSRSRRAASTHFGQMRGRINSCQTKQELDQLFCRGNASRRRR